MSAFTRLVILSLAVAPYLALAGTDAVMHERARRVPPIEQLFHALSAVTLLVFLVGVVVSSDRLAWSALGVFALSTAIDEIVFHHSLERRERRVHFISYGALAFFLCAWRALEWAT